MCVCVFIFVSNIVLNVWAELLDVLRRRNYDEGHGKKVPETATAVLTLIILYVKPSTCILLLFLLLLLCYYNSRRLASPSLVRSAQNARLQIHCFVVADSGVYPYSYRSRATGSLDNAKTEMKKRSGLPTSRMSVGISYIYSPHTLVYFTLL